MNDRNIGEVVCVSRNAIGKIAVTTIVDDLRLVNEHGNAVTPEETSATVMSKLFEYVRL